MPTSWSALVLPSLLVGAGAVAAAGPAAAAGSYAANIKVIRNGHYPLDIVDEVEIATRPKVEEFLAKKIAAGTNNNCTLENAAVRREWSDLSVAEREEYVAAVQCLMKLPAKAPKDKYPGAISRFDDFVAYHMTHAMELHDNYHLFPAHKHFIWVYEKALREECGYTGYQPYMNYDRYARDPINSPLFNGNASSMGGNGEPDPDYKGIPQPGRTPNILASAGGGGCVTSGPFSEYVAPDTEPPPQPRRDGLGHNPRCLRRDINRNASMGATAEHAYKLLTESNDINTFYNTLLGSPPPRNDPYPWGIHTAGHYIHGVDPGGDPGTSPGDPVFYFHHGALDRLWWIWQMQDPENRLNAVPMVGNVNHGGHWKRQRITDPLKMEIDLEWLAPSIPLIEAHNHLGGNGGEYCYIYI
ncbi:Tyrosinase [Madurella mycetomatis]|uniref:Tyrosinase n=1 Tax=Madurella mycetomatis TaxID=100816 RepID=A0A175W9V9_9PEZI|nr:Tyrosinase [Madurella mycetomatis]